MPGSVHGRHIILRLSSKDSQKLGWGLSCQHHHPMQTQSPGWEIEHLLNTSSDWQTLVMCQVWSQKKIIDFNDHKSYLRYGRKNPVLPTIMNLYKILCLEVQGTTKLPGAVTVQVNPVLVTCGQRGRIGGLSKTHIFVFGRWAPFAPGILPSTQILMLLLLCLTIRSSHMAPLVERSVW